MTLHDGAIKLYFIGKLAIKRFRIAAVFTCFHINARGVIFDNFKRIILIAVGVLVVVGVDSMAYHTAVLPNGNIIDFNGSLIAFNLEQARTGSLVGLQAFYGVGSADVNGIVVISVFDIQYAFIWVAGDYIAVLEIENYRVICRTGSSLSVSIYDLTGRIEGTVIKCVLPAGFCPKGIIYVLYLGCLCTGCVEGNIFKCSRFISPVVSTSIENAVFQCKMIDIRQSLCIIILNRSVQIHTADNGHILKGNIIAVLKTVITPAVRSVFFRSPNLPRCFIRTGAHKGKAFPRAFAFFAWLVTVSAVSSLCKINGRTIISNVHRLIQTLVGFFSCCANIFLVIITISDVNINFFRFCRKRHGRHERQHHDKRQHYCKCFFHCFFPFRFLYTKIPPRRFTP